MNSTQRKFGLMAAMAAMAAENPLIMDIPMPKTEPTPDWKRKKCKSCNLFPCKPYHNPMKEACEKYQKRKGNKH